MSRILILHAELGSGHRSAAEALAAALRGRPGVDLRVEDTLDHTNILARVLWSQSYQHMSERAHALYRALYAATDAADADAAVAGNLRVGRLSRRFLARTDELVATYRPDAVVCTMQFPLHLISQMRHSGALTAPLYVVVTDFVPHGSWIVPGVQAYFVPSEATAAAFERKGVDPALLRVTGTPLRPETAEPKCPQATRAALGLPEGRPVVTLFGGGVDASLLRRVVEDLLASPTPYSLVVVAGRNRRLETALAGLAGNETVGLICHGAISFVDDLLAASDLVVSKAGGLITSEALARGTPMILIQPIPGQEEWNADFVVSGGAGVQLRTPEAVAPTVAELLGDPPRRAEMAARARELGRPHAAQTIADTILADLEGAPAAPAPVELTISCRSRAEA